MSIPGGYPGAATREQYPDVYRENEEDRQTWRDSLENEASNARAQLANQRAATDRQYEVGMANARNGAEANAIDRWYKGEVVKLDQQRVKIEQATLELRDRIETGRLNLDSELGRGKLGLDAVSTAAQMGGPENYFQYLDYLGGAREVPGMANWLGALEGNRPGSAFNAPGPESMRPAVQSFGGMVEQLGGATAPASSNSGQSAGRGTDRPASELSDYDRGRRERREAREAGTAVDPQAAAAAAVVKAAPPSTTKGWSPDDIRALDVLGGIYGAGAHKMGPGVYESMSPAEKALFASGGRKKGFDPKEFLYAHEQSRVGQTAGQAGLA